MTDRTRPRIFTVILAPAAALLTWGCIRLGGADLAVKIGDGTVGAVDVVVAPLIGALAGWLVLLLLERHTDRPWLWWPAIGSSALSVSTIAPSHFADGGSAIALIGLHFATAIVVITGFATTLRSCRDRSASRGGDRPAHGNPAA